MATLFRWLRRERAFLLFLLGFGVFRTAMADWNPVPSGSMRPTILEGDVVLVNRLAYQVKLPLTDVVLARLDEPRRGDVVTFSSPRDGTRLIKRLVGLPGDVIELRDDRLWVNGVAATYTPLADVRERVGAAGIEVPALRLRERQGGTERTVQVLAGVPARRDFGPVRVPADHYFMLGDNRDDSADSRFIGAVPRALLIGRASRVLVSVDTRDGWRPRLDRWGSALE